MIALFSVLALASALLYLRAQQRGERPWIYVFKPLTTGLILLVAVAGGAPEAPFYKVAVVLGLAFSLAGDVWLMLPTDRFLSGLVSFLAAHVCYVAAFASATGFAVSIWTLLPFLLFGVLMLGVLRPHLGRLRGPVAVYGLVLVVMAWTAFEAWRQTQTPDALAAALGAVLFVISDAALAFNRFVRTFGWAQVLIMTTYYAAQWLIALSV